MNGSLFANQHSDKSPLAERMRPKTVDDFLGLENLFKHQGMLEQFSQKPFSFILWGPPGCGKTSLAKALASSCQLPFLSFSAVLSGIKEIKDVMARAKKRFEDYGQACVLFVDEIHRFNKSQQDAFLPAVERGEIVLVGATTENPSFEINAALLSRLQVFTLPPLNDKQIEYLLKRSVKDDKALNAFAKRVDAGVIPYLAHLANGDARYALNIFETALHALKKDEVLSQKKLASLIQKKTLLYDKNQEQHYNVISALHKSIRNSDADAALYWLAYMLEAGDDPLYVARRLIRFASEDIGNADPQALTLAIATKDSCAFLGMPECALALAQLVIYLSAAPKSNSVYVSYKKVQKDLKDGEVYPVPLHIRNAPTQLMKDLDYGKGYQYAHNHEHTVTNMTCLPEALKDMVYYEGKAQGQESDLIERLQQFKKLREK